MVANGFDGIWARTGFNSSVAMGRLVAYAASPPGVIRPQDLRVYATTPTANNQIHIGVGAAAIPNRYSQAFAENYLVRATQVTDLSIPASGSSARSHLVVVRVSDPDFGGQASVVPAIPEIIPDVPNTTVRAEQISQLLNVPAIALARIDVPAGQTNIQQGYITELREVAMPKYLPVNQVQKGPSGLERILVTDTAWKNWPSNLASVYVYPWATEADVTITVRGIHVENAADADTRIFFDGATQLGGGVQAIDYNGAPGTQVGNVETLQHSTQARFNVRAVAGTQRSVRLQAMRTFTTNTGRIEANPTSQVSFRIEFLERPY